VVGLQESTLRWLDTFSKGQLQLNDVETSKSAIARICPEMMVYFSSGIRMSRYALALLHAAARGQRVFLRDGDARLFVRRPGEDATSFLERLRGDAPDHTSASLPASPTEHSTGLHERGRSRAGARMLTRVDTDPSGWTVMRPKRLAGGGIGGGSLIAMRVSPTRKPP
jgi:hypothetical protein